ncbi:LolA family protein [Pelotomaculum propionicicum]|uniref:DUF4412 domain-containing protein n=1 Tax=Pelotomaculum propionicicum TaxID=258475 RepID=A0A4Y7RKQ5_9FIRM|nr:DUF4412 domain-containing protein [Pelotomaculum propionicicum]TEB09433.1 hypothetical protein Pmgp_03143 [Pelotomaculum propionicicum]
MKKRLPLFLVLFTLVFAVLALAGCGGKSQPASQSTGTQSAKEESIGDIIAKGKKVEGMSYEYTLTSKDGTMTGKVWMQGKMMKSETVMAGQKMISYIDGNTNTFITYNPDENTAMKITSPPTGQSTETPTDFTDEIDPAKLKVLETTTYEGYKCKVVESTSQDGKVVEKVWVSVDYGIPLRIETTDSVNGNTVMEYKNLKVGSIPAETFKLPAGVEVTDMSEMMKNLPQAPNVPGKQ